MKTKLIIILLATTIIGTGITGCGEDVSEGKLEKLLAKRDSLNTMQDSISTVIAELNEEIALLDTTKKLLIVTTTSVPVQKFEHYFEVQGNIEADKNVIVYPEAGGKIINIAVKEGQKVSKGQVLIQLDADVIRNSINEAESSYELAKTVYEKQKHLWDQNIGSEMQYLQAKTNKESAQARLSSLRAQLDMLTIKAPFAGIVDEIFPKIGEMAAPQMPALRLVDLENVYVKSDVSENYINRIKEGTEVIVTIPDQKEDLLSKIDLIGNYINPNNRTFKIRIDISNKEGKMKPNLLTKVKIKDFEKDSSVVLPERMIQQSPNGENFIYLVERKEGEIYVKKKTIKTGLSYQNMVMVTEGLKGGEEFIEKGSRSVKDGQRVEIAG